MAATNPIEPEEKVNQQIIEPEWNPLDEAVNEKPYAAPNFNADAADLAKPIEEPKFSPPPLKKAQPAPQDDIKKREPFNPELKQLSKKEVDNSAAAMAKQIISGYKWILSIANKFVQVSEKKLNSLQASGEINLNAMIDYDYGKKMRAGEFFEQYNNQVSDLLKVEPEFEEEVLPPLERVLAKRGIGLTDEQQVMFIFGKHIAANGMLFFQQKAVVRDMIQSIKEATVGQYTPPPPPPPQPRPQQQPKSDPPSQPINPEPVVNPDSKNEDNVTKSTSVPKSNDSVKPDLIIMPKKRSQGRPRKY